MNILDGMAGCARGMYFKYGTRSSCDNYRIFNRPIKNSDSLFQDGAWYPVRPKATRTTNTTTTTTTFATRATTAANQTCSCDRGPRPKDRCHLGLWAWPHSGPWAVSFGHFKYIPGFILLLCKCWDLRFICKKMHKDFIWIKVFEM